MKRRQRRCPAHARRPPKLLIESRTFESRPDRSLGASKHITFFERSSPTKVKIRSNDARCDAATEPGGCAYIKSKLHANDAFRQAEPRWRALGIRALAIQPGYVQTAMNNFSGRITPEVSARGIRRLCSNLLSNGFAGQFRQYDGKRIPW